MRKTFSNHRPTLLSLGLLFTIAGFSACISSTTATETALQTNNIVAQANQTNKQVKVFFPKNPQSYQDFSYLVPVTRTTNKTAIAEFAIEQLITGPTRQEKQRGLIDPIDLKGQSNCGGRDFTLSISKGTAKLQFCRTVPTAGIGDDARIKTAITRTLKQFSSIKSVVILENDGNCFKDASGDNLCLK